MNIELNRHEKELTVSLDGELNSATAPDFEKVISTSLKDVELLRLDFSKLSYLSSAGLRVVLVAQKIMMQRGKMVIKNANQDIMDIFSMTGFTNFLNFEN